MNQQAQRNTPLSLPAERQSDTQHDMASGPEAAFGAVLDALGLGIALVNDALVVRYANRAAGQWLDGADQPAGGGLAVDMSPSQRWQLMGAVRRASKGGWSMVMVGQAGCTRPVGIAPLLSDRAWRDVVAVLVLSGHSQLAGLSLQFFCQMHRLTHAEIQILTALSDGLTPEQIAQKGGVALSTVRSQIAAIRSKTQTSSIRHLLRLVSSLPPLMGAALSTPL